MELILAPLHGVTSRLFRDAYFRHFKGFDRVYGPFIVASPSATLEAGAFKDLEAPQAGSLGPVLVPQLLGRDPEEFLRCAGIIADLGYKEINWNLGCPYAMVAKKGRGAGLLPHTEEVMRFLDTVLPRLGMGLSLKVRLGWEDPQDLLRLLPRLGGLPLREIVIHPRLGIQMYKGEVDLEGFGAAAELCSQPLVYNGDISRREGFSLVAARFPQIDAWMLGRGALADPFLVESLAGLPSRPAPLVALKDFHEDLYASYCGSLSGPGHVLAKMLEVWDYLGARIGGAEDARLGMRKARSLGAYEIAARRVFSKGIWKGTV